MKAKKINNTIGFVGVGNMGKAIVEGIITNNVFKPEEIFVYDKISEKLASFAADWGTHQALSNAEISKNCGIIVLAVKPQDLEATLEELKPLKPKTMVISILAGTPIKKIRQMIKQPQSDQINIVRAMPNLGIKVNASMTGLACDNKDALNIAENIFLACGETVVLTDEAYFDLVTAISGSGPAYFFLLMELLVNEGVKNGFKTSVAQALAVHTALGAAKLAVNELGKQTPEELRKAVTSKGGTTAAALEVFEKHKIADIVSEAVTAAVNRGKELGKG